MLKQQRESVLNLTGEPVFCQICLLKGFVVVRLVSSTGGMELFVLQTKKCSCWHANGDLTPELRVTGNLLHFRGVDYLGSILF